MEKKYQNTILIIFTHPALQKSRVNSKLITHVSDIEGVIVHDLYETYPDFHINIGREQKLLIEHDIIVLHHPLYWFSIPALLKEWMDLVLQHMWAYGKKGKALHGKKLMTVTSTGGRESLFRKDGYNRHTMLEFLAPVKQTAFVCGMEYLPPFVVHGTHTVTNEDIIRHGEDYRKMITAMRDNRFNFEKALTMEKLNVDLDSLITEPLE